MKTCTRCSEEKPLESFGRDRKTKDGLHYWCKQCNREKSNNWRENNPEKAAKVLARWGANDWAKRNPEKRARTIRRYKDNHPGVMTATFAKRRAAKKQAVPGWVDMDAIKAVYAEAKFMSDITGMQCHVDHIVPLQSPIVCGLHVHQNLRVVVDFENKSKGNRYWPGMPGSVNVELAAFV